MPHKGTHSYLKNIAIFGASGLGREVLMLIHQINQVVPTWNMIGFYDDNPDTPKIINKYSYLGNSEDLEAVKEPLYVVIAIGNPSIKAQVSQKLRVSISSLPLLFTRMYPTRLTSLTRLGRVRLLRRVVSSLPISSWAGTYF